MLQASGIARGNVSWGSLTKCLRNGDGSPTSNCTAGPGCCEWEEDGGCFAAPQPFLNISLGIAATMTDMGGTVLKPQSATAGGNAYDLKAHETVVLRLVIETTRPPAVAHTSATDAAVSLSETANLQRLEAETAAFWERWWNASSIDLGPDRATLESFYYGSQYMLACFSRPDGVAAGLLGPWSLQDPVGWSDHLTTDYNVEGKIVILSRFVALSVSLIQKASLFQPTTGAPRPRTESTRCCLTSRR